MSLWYDKKAYALLKKCSDNKDVTEWNDYRKDTNHAPINLRFANLRNFYLVDADLRNVDLRGTDLDKMKCRNADVENTNINTSFYEIVYFLMALVSILFIWALKQYGINVKFMQGILYMMVVIMIAITSVTISSIMGNGIIISRGIAVGFGVGIVGFVIGFVIMGTMFISSIFSLDTIAGIGIVTTIIVMNKNLILSFKASNNIAIAYAKNPEKAIGFDVSYLKKISIPLSIRSSKQIRIVKELLGKVKDEKEKQELQKKLEELEKENEHDLEKEVYAETQQIKIQNALNHILKPYEYIENNIAMLRKHNYFFYGVIVILLSVFIYALFEDYIGTRSSQFIEVLGKDSVSFGSIFGVILFYSTPILFGMSIIVYAITQINKNIQSMETMQEQRRAIEVLQSTLLAQTEIADVSDDEIKALTQALQKGALERMFGQDKTSQGSEKATSSYREKLLLNSLNKFLMQALKK